MNDFQKKLTALFCTMSFYQIGFLHQYQKYIISLHLKNYKMNLCCLSFQEVIQFPPHHNFPHLYISPLLVLLDFVTSIIALLPYIHLTFLRSFKVKLRWRAMYINIPHLLRGNKLYAQPYFLTCMQTVQVQLSLLLVRK